MMSDWLLLLSSLLLGLLASLSSSASLLSSAAVPTGNGSCPNFDPHEISDDIFFFSRARGYLASSFSAQSDLRQTHAEPAPNNPLLFRNKRDRF